MTNPYAQYQPAPPAAPGWPQYAPRPSLTLVVVCTLFLGVFGAIVAYQEAEKARRWGQDVTVYWAAWFAIWAAESLIGLIIFLFLFTHPVIVF